MTDYFQEAVFAAAIAVGIFCLVLSSCGHRPSRTIAAAMASVCLAASGWLASGQVEPSIAVSILSPLFVVLAAGFAAEALSGSAFSKPLAGGLNAFFKGRYKYIDMWLDTTEKISSRADSAEIKSFLSGICAETVGSSAVYVWLFDGASGTFTANSVKIDQGLRRIRPGHAMLEHVRANGGAPFLLEDISEDNETGLLVRGLGAVVCAPLICHREISGLMLLGKKRGRAGYTEYDLRLLRAIATQAAVQLKNIRLSSDLFDMKESDLFSKMSSFVAHDLKNLTNSLSLLSHNAKKSICDPAFQQEALKAIDATAVKMRALAGKMAGAMRGLELNRSSSDLRRVLLRAAGRLDPAAQARLLVEHGEPLFCWVDEELIETVFFNMLSNASEATTDAEEIRVTFKSSGGSSSVIIYDNGTGIPLPYLENWLFRPFRTTKKDGFGIGLYQSKTVMEAHRGSIEVESEEGKGTTFTLKFPASSGSGEIGLVG